MSSKLTLIRQKLGNKIYKRSLNKKKVSIQSVYLVREHGHAEQDVHLEVEESSSRRQTFAEHDREPGHERPRGFLTTGN